MLKNCLETLFFRSPNIKSSRALNTEMAASTSYSKMWKSQLQLIWCFWNQKLHAIPARFFYWRVHDHEVFLFASVAFSSPFSQIGMSIFIYLEWKKYESYVENNLKTWMINDHQLNAKKVKEIQVRNGNLEQWEYTTYTVRKGFAWNIDFFQEILFDIILNKS